MHCLLYIFKLYVLSEL
uniref:Uncharacterized protein n=1 Tax=Rhizophora mucronata TaxID=61149 RepID=A0A2P2NWC5_RHIMU